MREIEIKAKVTDPKGLLQRITDLGITLSDPIKQHDVVYAEPGSTDNALNSNWLRIRIENDERAYFTLKRSVVGHLDSIEHETLVDNADELRAIVEQLGFTQYSDLTKIRRKGAYGDIELCLDEVPGLGNFVEAELIMHKDSDHDKVICRLWDLFDSLSIHKSDEVHEGYDVLERKKRGIV